MAEEVDIGNVGGANGVASEVTLVRLVAAMESMASAQGGGMDPKKVQAILKENYKIIQESTFQQKEKNKEEKKNRKPVQKFRNAINGATKAILSFGGAVTGQLLGGVANFTKALFGSEDSLESFAKIVPFVGGILGRFAGLLDANLAAFRSLSEAGATFGVGLNGLRLAAANAAMPFDMFVGVITENADRMRLFGATTATAGLAFGQMSRDFRKGPGKELMNLGFSVADLNDLLLDYTEYQDRQYGVDRRNNKVSEEELAAYGEELMLLSAVTGKQRKAIQAELTAKMEDARNAQAISRMNDDQQKNFRAAMTVSSSLGPEMAEAVTDMVDGIPKPGSVSEGLMAMSETFRNDAANLKNMDVGAQLQFFENVKKEVEARAGGMSEAAFQQLVGGSTSFGAALRASTELATFSFAEMENAIAEAEKRIELEKQKDEALKQFSQDIIDLRSRIAEIFFDKGGPMEVLAAGFNKLTDFFVKEENKETITSAMRKLANGLVMLMEAVEQFINDLSTYDLKTAIFGGKKDQVIGKNEDGTDRVLDKDVAGLFGQAGDTKGFGKVVGEALGAAIKTLIGDINWGGIPIGGLMGAAGLAALFLLPLTGPVGIAVKLGAALLGLGTAAYFAGAFDPAIEAISGWATSIGNMWTDGKAAVVEKYNSAIDGIKGIGTSIADTWDDTKQGISNSWTRAKNNVVTIGTSIADTWDDTKQAISTKWTTAKDSVKAIGTSIADTWDDTKAKISTKWSDAKTSVVNIGSKLSTSFNDIDWSKYSIKSQFTKVWDAIKDFFTFDFTMPNFRDFLPTWLGGKGKEIGENLPPEMESKVNAQLPNPQDAVAKAGVLQEAKQAVATIIDVPTLKDALTAIKEGMNTAAVKSYAEALAEVAEQLLAINEAAKDQTTTISSRRGTKTVNQASAAADVLSGSTPFGQNPQTESLDTLNTTMQAILEELQSQTPSIKKTAKEASGNVANSVIPSSG